MAKVITLFSTKGGTGKTLISLNLAVSLAKRGKKVLLVDGDCSVVGDMARMLDLKAKKSLADLSYLLRKSKSVNEKDFILKYKGGLDFVPAVLRPQQMHSLPPEGIKEVLSLFSYYDYVVIDGGNAFNERQIRIFDQSNLLLFVVTPDILSIYQTKWALDSLQSFGFPLKMVKIIVNRAKSIASITSQEIKVALSCEIMALVPSEGKYAMLSVNNKVPLVESYPSSKIAHALIKFSYDIIKRKDIYIEHKEPSDIKFKKERKEEEFWQQMGLAEMMGKRWGEADKEEDDMIALKQRIHHRLISNLDLKRLDLSIFSNFQRIEDLRRRAKNLINQILADESNSLLGSAETRRKLIQEIIDEALGLGPLEEFLKDDNITEVMVNNKKEVYIEKDGKIELTNKRFISDEQVKTVIERIIAPLGRHIDESVPMVDARLPDGSRVNAIIHPLSLTGPTLTIRKFRKEVFSPEELIKLNTLTAPMRDFLKACVVSRKNMIVSGGTGSGKTTILNIISSFIGKSERTITIEDAAEIKLPNPHWIRLESRPSNIEGRGSITIRDLFKNTLRMRPDRIIIGECRGSESLDMLQAMNTGHDGSLTTIHANSTHDVLSRLDSLVLMSGVELPIRAIREMVSSAIDVIVHTNRLSDGTRKIVQITELCATEDGKDIALKDIFEFKQTGVDPQGKVLGYFSATGYIPSFFDEFKSRGMDIGKDMFTPERPSS